jgi:hypothetical protein
MNQIQRSFHRVFRFAQTRDPLLRFRQVNASCATLRLAGLDGTMPKESVHLNFLFVWDDGVQVRTVA